MPNLLEQAAKKAGWTGLGRACGVSYMAVQKWARDERLPLACHVELQDYHHKIAEAVDQQITAERLLEWSMKSWERKYAA